MDSQDLQEYKVPWVFQENPECQASKETWVLRVHPAFLDFAGIKVLLVWRESQGSPVTKVCLAPTAPPASLALRERAATSDCPETQDSPAHQARKGRTDSREFLVSAGRLASQAPKVPQGTWDRREFQESKGTWDRQDRRVWENRETRACLALKGPLGSKETQD